MHRYMNQTMIIEVPPGYPHGDAWGHIRGYPESHDVERYLVLQAEKQKKGKK